MMPDCRPFLLHTVVWLALLGLLFGTANAAGLEKVSFPLAPKDAIAFTLLTKTGPQPVLIREIEALGLYSVTTRTPWERDEFTFEGALFKDVLAHLDLADAKAIYLVAADDFSVRVPHEDWAAGSLILATRRSGELLTRRNQGPTRLIYATKQNVNFTAPKFKPRWIWLIKTMERAE